MHFEEFFKIVIYLCSKNCSLRWSDRIYSGIALLCRYFWYSVLFFIQIYSYLNLNDAFCCIYPCFALYAWHFRLSWYCRIRFSWVLFEFHARLSIRWFDLDMVCYTTSVHWSFVHLLINIDHLFMYKILWTFSSNLSFIWNCFFTFKFWFSINKRTHFAQWGQRRIS